jgi:hypothetical protein
MPVSKNRKNHKSKVRNYQNRLAENRNNIKKWLNAVQDLNKEIAEPNTVYVSGANYTAQLPEINNENHE